MFSHLTVGSNDIAKSKGFYDSVTKPLGLVRHMEFPEGVGYGRFRFPREKVLVMLAVT